MKIQSAEVNFISERNEPKVVKEGSEHRELK